MNRGRPKRRDRSQVLAWAVWDFGATGLNAIVVTFVFSIYLTHGVGEDLPRGPSATSWLGWALCAAGLMVALLAPVTGVWVDAPWRRQAHAGRAQRDRWWC